MLEANGGEESFGASLDARRDAYLEPCDELLLHLAGALVQDFVTQKAAPLVEGAGLGRGSLEEHHHVVAELRCDDGALLAWLREARGGAGKGKSVGRMFGG